MWDGAGGASRAGWERPGARARGGPARACERGPCVGHRAPQPGTPAPRPRDDPPPLPLRGVPAPPPVSHDEGGAPWAEWGEGDSEI